MTKEEFKHFIQDEMYKRNFKRVKGMYYLPFGDSMLCGVYLQKSDYSASYYVRVYFFIEPQSQHPSIYDHDIGCSLRFKIKSLSDGWGPIEYEYYEYDELSELFAEQYDALVLPVIEKGKKYILEHLSKKYYLHPLREAEILQKLSQP